MSSDEKWAYLEYLAKIRRENKELFSKCQICGKPSSTINADGYRVYPVCQDHSGKDVSSL
jgi:hypothetical protein